MAGKLLRRQTSLQEVLSRIICSSARPSFQQQTPSLAFVAPPLFEPGCAETCKARDLRGCLLNSRGCSASAAAVAEVAQQEANTQFQDPLEETNVHLTAAGEFSIEFFTGDVRGAGTPVPATIRLIGTEGESQDFILGDDPEEPGFRRGESKSYKLQVDKDLGDLRRVFVRQVGVSSYCQA